MRRYIDVKLLISGVALSCAGLLFLTTRTPDSDHSVRKTRDTTIVRVPAEAETQDAPTGPRFVMKPYGYHETHESLTEIGESNRAENDALGYAKVKAKNYSTLDWLSDAVSTTSAARVWEKLSPDKFERDANYTNDVHEQLLRQALEIGMPKKWLRKINIAISEEHFYHLYAQAYESWQAEKRISESW